MIQARGRIISWYLGAFLMPPAVWLLLGWYANIWSLNELIQILVSPFIWVYVAIYVSLATIILLHEVRIVEKWKNHGGDGNLKRALRAIRRMPYLFSFNIIVYILVGSPVVLIGQDFISSTDKWLAEATGLPIIFLFAAPFFIRFMHNIEVFSGNIPLSSEINFMSLRQKMTLTLGFTVVGVVVLFILFNISVMYAYKTKTGQELFQIILIKDSVAGLISIAIIGLNVLMIISTVSEPISKVESSLSMMLRNINRGEADLSVDISVNSRDEIGYFANRLNELVISMRNLINMIKSNAYKLSRASEELTVISAHVATGAEKADLDAEQAASASEQLSVNMNTMASTTEEMSVNISSVASAAEQISQNMNSITQTADSLTSSMDSILKSSQESSEISYSAKEMAETATHSMSSLGDAANEIGEVTTVIKGIAEKTNLLALNATIEAASAGDAGKGFAVVAIEIKELANQSAKAAEDIARRISEVQVSTTGAIKVINDVAKIINQINQSTDSINNAVNQQTKAMENINVNIGETNRGIQNIAKSVQELTVGSSDLSRNAGEAARGTETISRNIFTVSNTIAGNSDSAKKVDTSAKQLFRISEELNTQVSRFIVSAKVDKSLLREKFTVMVEDHIARGKEIKSMLEGGELVHAVSDSECALGHWLYNEGVQTWGSLTEFKNVMDTHKMIHDLLAEARKVYEEGNYEKAKEAYESWQEVSAELRSQIELLKEAILSSNDTELQEG